MFRAKLALLMSCAMVAACQPSPGASPTAPQSSTPTVTPRPSPGQTPSAHPSTGASLRQVLITGKVYDEAGMPLDDAQVEVRCEQYPQLNQIVKVLGGSYSVHEIPERAVVTLTASKDGYTARRRTMEALILPDGAGYNPNRIDFGGHDRGVQYALSRFPEIAEVIPANKEEGVTTAPLTVKLRLSHVMPVDQREKFENLLRLRFRAAGEDFELHPRFAYGDIKARFEWDEDGRGGAFVFDGAIVTRANLETTVTFGLDQEAELESWPEDAEGRMLGRDRVEETIEGTGARARNQVAAFVRPAFEDVRPSTRPEPLALWGQTHQTTTTFTLASAQAELKVVKVEAASSLGTQPDRFLITFDRPVRGFPEKALDGSALKASNYRYVLGNTDKKAGQSSFEEADPRRGGMSPDSAKPYFSTTNDRMVVLPLPSGAFSNMTNFKLYINEAVKDASGNGLASGGTVVEGTI